MADNYLEKKMEEHRRGTVRTVARSLSPVGERRGTVSFKIDDLRVLVTDGDSDCGAATVRRLREAGCKVAFVAADNRTGRNLAQAVGARHYPASFSGDVAEDLFKAWGGIDVAVVCGTGRSGVEAAKRIVLISEAPDLLPVKDKTVNAVDPRGLKPSEVAHLCLLLCLKDSECLNGVCLGAR